LARVIAHLALGVCVGEGEVVADRAPKAALLDGLCVSETRRQGSRAPPKTSFRRHVVSENRCLGIGRAGQNGADQMLLVYFLAPAGFTPIGLLK